MKYAFTNGILLDGTKDMAPRDGHVLITEDTRIVSIVPAQDADLKDCQVIDLQGRYAMPGLINLHVHLPASGKPVKKQKDARKLVRIMTSNGVLRRVAQSICEKYAQTQLLSGVTTIRTVGGILNMDSIARDHIRAGKKIGPRILASNMAVSVPDGHMAGSLAYEARSEADAKAYVDKIAADHPDLIKLMITGGVLDAKVKGEPGVLKMKGAFVRAACEKAHELGMMVAAHVESPEGVRVALENGVDTIEHGATPDEEIINLFQEKKAALVTTLSPALPYALFDRSISHVSEMEQYNGNVVFEGIQACAKACLENGIPVGMGTDTGCPYVTHYDMWREVNYFHKYCNVSPAFALHTATLGNAQIAHIDDVTGSLEAGKEADLMVTKENPLENLQALRQVDMVMARGRLIQNPQVKKMPAVEAELDKFL